jgi:hypothetical protein
MPLLLAGGKPSSTHGPAPASATHTADRASSATACESATGVWRREAASDLSRDGQTGHLAGRPLRGHHCAMDERDIVILMEALFDIRTRIVEIHAALFDGGDDDEGPETEADS